MAELVQFVDVALGADDVRVVVLLAEAFDTQTRPPELGWIARRHATRDNGCTELQLEALPSGGTRVLYRERGLGFASLLSAVLTLAALRIWTAASRSAAAVRASLLTDVAA
jgi:hypothetical protein